MKYTHALNPSSSLNEPHSKSTTDSSFTTSLHNNDESMSTPLLPSTLSWPLSSSPFIPNSIPYLTLSNSDKLIYRKEYPPELWLPYEPCFWPEGLLSIKKEKKGPLCWWYLPEPYLSRFIQSYSTFSNPYQTLSSSSFSSSNNTKSRSSNQTHSHISNVKYPTPPHDVYLTMLLQECHAHDISIPTSIDKMQMDSQQEEPLFNDFHFCYQIHCSHDDWVPLFSLTSNPNEYDRILWVLRVLVRHHPNQEIKSNLLAILSMFQLGYGLPQDLNQALQLHVSKLPTSSSLSSPQSMSSKPKDNLPSHSSLPLQSKPPLSSSISTTITNTTTTTTSRPLTSTYFAKRMIGHALGKTIVTKKDKETHLALIEKNKTDLSHSKKSSLSSNEY